MTMNRYLTERMKMPSSLLKWLFDFFMEKVVTTDLKQNIIDAAREAAAKTETEFDDLAVDLLAALLGVK